MKYIVEIISFLSDFFTVIASGIAIYIFIFKKENITSIFRVLVNYTAQITLSELKYKIDKLNELTIKEPTHIDEIHCLFHDISGQIKGNEKLNSQCENILRKIDDFICNKKLMNEPVKRSLVSELRECLRHVDLANFEKIIGGKQ